MRHCTKRQPIINRVSLRAQHMQCDGKRHLFAFGRVGYYCFHYERKIKTTHENRKDYK
jgi:hypothetical protein